MAGWLAGLLTLGCAVGSGTDTVSGPVTLGSNGHDEGSGTGDSDDAGSASATSAAATTITTAAEGSGDGATSSGGDAPGSSSGGPPADIIDCDPRWDLDPDLPVSGQPLWAGFTDGPGHTNRRPLARNPSERGVAHRRTTSLPRS